MQRATGKSIPLDDQPQSSKSGMFGVDMLKENCQQILRDITMLLVHELK